MPFSAIIRTAAFFGLRGVILPEARNAPVTSVVYDVASGGCEALPIAVEANLRRALALARAAGIWVVGSDERAEEDVATIPHDRPWLLVVGNEETGLRRLTRETCDRVVRVPPHGGGVRVPPGGGGVRSLNVSVATGVLLAALRA